MIEVWKFIPGYEAYEVSSFGRVRRFKTKKQKAFCEKRGYLHVLLWKNNKGKSFAVHRLVLFAFVGMSPIGYVGAHLNGKSHDNRLSNLKWITPMENEKHKAIHGTKLFAEKTPSAKLKNKQILEIRKLRKTGMTHLAISKLFGVHEATIRSILIGKSWKDIP
jgi:hypothetical protein